MSFTGQRVRASGARMGQKNGAYQQRVCDCCQVDLTPRLVGERVRMPIHAVISFVHQGTIVIGKHEPMGKNGQTVHLCMQCMAMNKGAIDVFLDTLKGAK